MIIAALIKRLKADAGVSNKVETRVFAGFAPRGKSYPCITLLIVSEPDVRSLSGPSGLASPRVQVNCWAETLQEADEVDDAVRLCLDGFHGAIDDENIDCIESANKGHIPLVSAENADLTIHGARRDFIVWHAQSRPSHVLT